MTYQDADLIIEKTKHLFTGTNYKVDYGLDAETYFETLDGEWVEYDDLPDNIRIAFDEIVESLNIQF